MDLCFCADDCVNSIVRLLNCTTNCVKVEVLLRQCVSVTLPIMVDRGGRVGRFLAIGSRSFSLVRRQECRFVAFAGAMRWFCRNILKRYCSLELLSLTVFVWFRIGYCR